MTELLFAGTGIGGLLAAVLIRIIYKQYTGGATITVTQTCDNSFIVRVRTGFSLPRYVRTGLGSTSLWLTKAANYKSQEVAVAAGYTALAQLGCRKSVGITVRYVI